MILNKAGRDGIARETNVADVVGMMEREDEESVLPVVVELSLEGTSVEGVLLLLIVELASADNPHVDVTEVSIVDFNFRSENPPARVLRMVAKVLSESRVCVQEGLCVEFLKTLFGVDSFNGAFGHNGETEPEKGDNQDSFHEV